MFFDEMLCIFSRDLNPLLSPKWSMRMRTSENPVCSMGEFPESSWYINHLFAIPHSVVLVMLT